MTMLLVTSRLLVTVTVKQLICLRGFYVVSDGDGSGDGDGDKDSDGNLGSYLRICCRSIFANLHDSTRVYYLGRTVSLCLKRISPIRQ